MTNLWTIRVRTAGAVTVTGFASTQGARQHTGKHFLALQEHWEQLDDSLPRLRSDEQQTKAAHGPVSPPYYAFLDTTSGRYVDVVRSETESAIRAESLVHRDERGQMVPRIGVVTRQGVYAAFSGASADRLSDLRTAYRRCVRAIKNPRLADYLTGAHAVLNAQLQRTRFSDD